METHSRKKVVIDTSVLIRTTFQQRSPVSRRIYQAIYAQECILVTSPAILAEVKDVLQRDYIIALSHTTPALRTRYLQELRAISLLVPGTTPIKRTSRDRKDNKFLVCAHEANADYLVTSDEDLL